MSQLSQLKARIDGLANQAKNMGGTLGSFSQKFGQSIGEVSATIGGSAQSKDQQVIAHLNEAKSKVAEATAALQQAAKTAQSYGQSL